jgi:hypothetical protein
LNRGSASRFLVALLIALFVFFLHLPQTRDSLLFDDAADYMRAAQAPIVSTWLNTNSVTPLEILHRRSSDPDFGKHPWFSLYLAGDNAALRHFHTPVTAYILHIVRGFFSSDQCARVLWSVAGALLCGLLYLVLAEFSVPLIVAALIALYAGVQTTLIEVSVDPTPHVWFLLFALSFLYFLARYFVSQRPRDLYLSAVVLAFAVATLEFSLELIFTVPLAVTVLWITRREALPPRSIALKSALRAFAVFLASTFVIWPGGWIRGGYLECYGILGASVLTRNKGYHTRSLANHVLFKASSGHASIWILAGLGLAAGLWMLFTKRLSIPSIVFASCAVFAFGLGVADHFILSTFFFEFALILMATAGLILGDLFRELKGANWLPSSTSTLARQACFALVCALLLVGSVFELRPAHRSEFWDDRAWLANVFAGIRQQVPAGATVMAINDHQALSLYLPQYHVVFWPDYHSQPEDITPFLVSSSLLRPGEGYYGIGIQQEVMPAGAQTLGIYPMRPESKATPEIPGGNHEFLWREP